MAPIRSAQRPFGQTFLCLLYRRFYPLFVATAASIAGILPGPREIADIASQNPAHWTGRYLSSGLDSFRPAVAKRVAVLVEARAGVTSPLELRELPHSRVVLKREHWELVRRMNGTAAIRDIAEECGLSLHDAIDRIGYLLKKGMCAPRPVRVAPEFPAAPVTALIPDQEEEDQSPPSPEQLQRVLDGLRRLS